MRAEVGKVEEIEAMKSTWRLARDSRDLGPECFHISALGGLRFDSQPAHGEISLLPSPPPLKFRVHVRFSLHVG